MKKDSAILVLGLLVALMPFLGFPGAWENWFFLGAGLGVAILGYLLRRDIVHGKHCEHFMHGEVNDTFSQNGSNHERKEITQKNNEQYSTQPEL
ncbi:hypothetical protein COU17_03305 [Candidatus Kaiserbacteria bacterium CG10_big_fil_rev_8_21_14_0_10_49_17]|uniref:Uncharacterized protein n=1 Tax=Candidatus Kaiserbacteria bacterium CG10_big_fil_rev_8_21_14_0_10_49_17 TaxID=1974609 RepID=A0A2M6WDV8_9BACT|nr:MAG: hypothetical protein COU17_03305 [Candidatus Kaiserbacteria bacterium CG10_big_fil_rev_8_21_14_0_10_49_17]